MADYRLVLASASPRRQEILSLAGIVFEVQKSGAGERTDKTVPAEIVCALSEKKAARVAERIVKGAEGKERFLLVLGADTLVASERGASAEIYGKPETEEAAVRMIAAIQGKRHYVYTGVTVFVYGRAEAGYAFLEKISFSEETAVEVAPMAAEEIRAYVAKGESLDKAGAYAVQGSFAPFIKRIEGDYYNVVGLPLHGVYWRLKPYLLPDIRK